MEIPNEKPPPLPPQISPPQLALHAAPHLLHLCEMDSLMPSPSRSLETGYESPIRTLGEQDFTGTPNYVKAPKVTQNQLPISHSRLGAWATPLTAVTPLATSIPRDSCKNLISDLASHSQWPTLAAGNQIPTSRPSISSPLHSHQKASEVHDRATVKTASVSSKANPITNNNHAANNPRFPWAARMNPSTRNLHRVTSPVYMEDGTPKVQIPDHVLLQGLENQREYVVGQFYRCSMPSGGLIHAVINSIWGRKCRIFCRKLGENSYIFHIPDASTRTWVLQRGLWHVDDCIMFVAPWNPTASLALPEISTVPVWVTLKNIPSQLYSILGIKWIASGLGEPMLTNKPRLDPTTLGEAKIMVEVELDKPFPQKIAAEDKEGTISMVDVEYTWLPSKCKRCGQLGHKESRCLLPPQIGPVSPIISATSTATALVEERLIVPKLSVVSDPAAPPLEAEVTTSDSAPITVPNSVIATTNEYATPQITEHTITVATATISSEPLIVEPVYTVQTCPASSQILPLPGTEDSTSHEATAAAATMSTPVIIKAASENYTEPSDAEQITVSSLEGISPLIDSTSPVISHHTTSATEGNKLSTISSESLPNSEVEVVSPSLVIPTSPAATISPPLESYRVISTPPGVTTYEFGYEEMANSVMEVPENTFALLEPMENDLNSELLEDVDNTSIQRTLRERPVKPTQKAQEMQWTVVGGRGNRGRRGRGGRGHHS